jgi:hypothetical protein
VAELEPLGILETNCEERHQCLQILAVNEEGRAVDLGERIGAALQDVAAITIDGAIGAYEDDTDKIALALLNWNLPLLILLLEQSLLVRLTGYAIDQANQELERGGAFDCHQITYCHSSQQVVIVDVDDCAAGIDVDDAPKKAALLKIDRTLCCLVGHFNTSSMNLSNCQRSEFGKSSEPALVWTRVPSGISLSMAITLGESASSLVAASVSSRVSIRQGRPCLILGSRCFWRCESLNPKPIASMPLAESTARLPKLMW